MLGRNRPAPAPSNNDAAELARLRAAVDQVLTLNRAAAMANRTNITLCDLALDTTNLLRQGLSQ